MSSFASKAVVQAAARAMSTVARRSTGAVLPPVAVLSDYGSRVLAHGFPQEPRLPTTPPKMPFVETVKEDLDPCDFGYRVVTPPTEDAFIYTDSSSYTTETSGGGAYSSFHEPVTTSTLGSIVSYEDDASYAAQEVLAAQQEWDALMAVEASTRPPHFEYYKEDPYVSEQRSRFTTYRNFSAAVIDTHTYDDDEEEGLPDAA
jgi:hypothetical protein